MELNRAPGNGVFPKGMKIVLDADVEKVLAFMVRETKGERLLFVARPVAKVAELPLTDATSRPPSSKCNRMIRVGWGSYRAF
jgi:hypothetical protein